MTDDDARELAAIFRPTQSTFSPETLDQIEANNARWFRDTLPRSAFYQSLRAEIKPLVDRLIAERAQPDDAGR